MFFDDYFDDTYKCEDCDNPFPHLHIIPMQEVLSYDSCDALWSENCVLDVVNRKRDDYPQISSLREIIMKEGFRMGYGISIDESRYICDGHHRLTVLYDLGAQWCPIQTRQTHAMDTPEYHTLKQKAYNIRWKEKV